MGSDSVGRGGGKTTAAAATVGDCVVGGDSVCCDSGSVGFSVGGGESDSVRGGGKTTGLAMAIEFR